MALTATDRGTGSNNSASTSMTLAPASNMTQGALGVLHIALDNAGASGSTAAAPASFTDAKGNTWTRRQDAIFDPGAASAGVELAIYTATLTAALLTSDTSTINWASAVSVTAKAWTLREWTAGAGKFASYVTGAVNTGATTGTPTVTTSSIPSGDGIGCSGAAESADTWTGDADTTNGSWSAQQHTGVGSGNSGISITSQGKVVTATATQTYNPTLTSADCILAWIQVTELNAYTLTAGQGSVVLTGNATAFPLGRKITAAQGSFTETGNNTGLLFGRRLPANSGSISLTGNAVTLTRSSPNHVLDSATDTDGTNANAHTPEEGGALSKPATYQNGADVFIFNNQFTKDGNAAAVIYYYAAEPGLNCSAGGRFKKLSVVSANLSLVLRLQTGSDNYYFARHNHDDQQFSIRKSTNGTPSTLGTVSYTLNTNDTADVEFYCVDIGGIAHLWLRVNGVEILRVTDSSPHTTGRSGFRFSGAASSTTGYALENFFSYAAHLTEAAAGSLALTGRAVTLTRGYLLAAGVGTFIQTANVVNLRATRMLSASQGSFSETGQAASLRVGRTVAASQGSLVETGNATNLFIGRLLSAIAGVFTETGSNTSLLTARRVSAVSGALSVNGIAVSLRAARRLVVEVGTFVETGVATGLVYQPAGHFVISANSGSVVVSGNAANLLRARVISAAPGVFSETGQAASLLMNRRLAASAGSFQETGFTQALLRSLVNSVPAGSFVEMGFAAALLRSLQIQAQAGSFNLSGDIALRYDRKLIAAFASFLCDGGDVGLTQAAANKEMLVASGFFTLTGFAPAFRFHSFRALPQDITRIGKSDNVLSVGRSSATLIIAPD